MIGKEYHEYKYKTYHKLYHSTDQCCCTGMHRPVYKISCCRTLKRPAGLCTDQKYIPIRISRKQRSCIRDTAKPESFLLQNQRIFFLICALVILIFAIWIYGKLPNAQRYLPLRICAVLIVGGAFGNCIDRIRLNYVVDFFYFKLIDFPIFNVADIYVTVAAFLLVILILVYYKEEDLERIFHRS